MRERSTWFLFTVAAIIGIIGLGLIGAGFYLVSLGGSWYYAITGIGMVATAFLLFRRSPFALILYAAIILGTLIWAVVEIGFDWWKLVPRGDIVFILGILLLLPWVTTRLGRDRTERPLLFWRGAALPLALSLVIAAVVGVFSITRDHDQHGSLPEEARAQVPQAYAGVPDKDWTAYGRSGRGDKWSPLKQINAGNVSQLDVAWQIQTGDVKREGDPNETTYEVTPLKVGDTLYLCTPHNIVLALDAETGKERWRFDPKITVSPRLQHLTCRGVSYHDANAQGAVRAANNECPQRIFMATNDTRLFALDAHTGQPCPGFGENGQVNMWRGMPAQQEGWYQFTSAPLVTRGLVVLAGAVYDNAAVSMPSGVIRAFDAATGQLVWNFDPGNPENTAPIGPDQHYSWSSPNSWSTSSVDEELGLIYVPMGMGAIDQWGANRPETTERFATSILALEVATGRVRWVYQTVHHDLWDMDVPSQPVLVDLSMPSGPVPALVQSTKTGNIFVLDRRTGAPIHPVTEKPVPGGAVEGDWTAPTQPFSSVSLMPEPPIMEADMWGATMFDQLACRIKFKSLRYEGPFTPPSTQGTIVYPGNFGVTDWGGLAVDPVRQVAFVNPDYMAFVDQLVPQEVKPQGNGAQATAQPEGKGPAGGSDVQGSDEHGLNPNAGAPYAVALNPFLSPVGLPCQSPPWGYVAGVDLVSGKVVYKRKNGTTRDETPVIPLPFKMGVPSLGGPMVTAGNLGFLTATLDYYIRGYNLSTGEQLWEARLPAGAQATPMTYWSDASNRQFVVAVAGGHGSLGTDLGDHVIAYALPKGSAAAGTQP
ncbi:membrane-bound PQQ-dependent dehydrogenase, glucose/quinate/shikimate family [Mesorhizobium sp. RP14(2022)]|uniref:Membrane-bound PQQ-dependent dehydrogenase, glucose/quinate/shikimate family n=1 Tax=Mesorhizobium liriopis TaxID=2953882 RepID=A0ABT1C3H9_9HYPH|nr:membrane-bound PQQ-dependent dehydrogenase, glucose/quinate/shikimate family [Mesorhizobium liriopis]MCO6049058.1 membrane-bound PQQ-dependent dehydrogenase, glucose/quinate/shikimate family [Mesorhizobium liriopis]